MALLLYMVMNVWGWENISLVALLTFPTEAFTETY